ncbi:hypothetical protein L2E82_35485 [Cichorium intybus]|uniref:Uncharacterized protein n=1 Tax=Cichorium intybus TaxID=13427 RepID=A0ACB9BP64_CICIN|nr:hypothetical protein L2E82_35485 [Cichorium intybus]
MGFSILPLLTERMSSDQYVPHSNPGNVTSILSLCSKVTLDGTNYNDCIRNIEMALRFEHKEYRIYEDYWPYEMHKELAEKFCKQERIERREVVKAFTNGKPKDRESICTHV